jgi:hypothetical protein
VARGVCDVGPDGYLRRVTEHVDIIKGSPRFSGDETVSMNMWGFLPDLFARLRDGFERFKAERGSDPKAEYFIPSVVTELIETGRAKVRVLSTPDACFGVTYKDDRPSVVAAVRRLIEAGCYPERLWM